MKKERTIEELIKLLEVNADKLKSGECTLDENLKLYSESVDLYKEAEKILNTYKQRIEIVDPSTGEIADFDEYQ